MDNYSYSYHCKIFSHEGSFRLNGIESQSPLTSFHQNLALVANELPGFCLLLSRTTQWGEPPCVALCVSKAGCSVGRYSSHGNVHELHSIYLSFLETSSCENQTVLSLPAWLCGALVSAALTLSLDLVLALKQLYQGLALWQVRPGPLVSIQGVMLLVFKAV